MYGIYKEAAQIYEWRGVEYNTYESTDSTEFLLYDFNLAVGDTVSVASFEDITPDFLGWGGIGVYKAFRNYSADTIEYLYDNTTRRKIHISLDLYHENPQTWIEGIGGNMGTFMRAYFDAYHDDGPSEHQLICFEHNDTMIYKNRNADYDFTDDCYSLGDTIGIGENSIAPFIIYPNPTNGKLFIDLSNIPASKWDNIIIFDACGKCMMRFKPAQPLNEIDLSYLAKGLYILSMPSEEKVVNRVKFIKK